MIQLKLSKGSWDAMEGQGYVKRSRLIELDWFSKIIFIKIEVLKWNWHITTLREFDLEEPPQM